MQPNDVKKVIGEYFSLLLSKFDEAFQERWIDPAEEEQRKAELVALKKEVLAKDKFPGHVTYLLYQYQQNVLNKKTHLVLAHEIGYLLLNGNTPMSWVKFLGEPSPNNI